VGSPRTRNFRNVAGPALGSLFHKGKNRRRGGGCSAAFVRNKILHEETEKNPQETPAAFRGKEKYPKQATKKGGGFSQKLKKGHRRTSGSCYGSTKWSF